MIKKLFILFSLILTLSTALIIPMPIKAQSAVQILDTTSEAPRQSSVCKTKYDCGDYNLDDMLALVIRASKWVLGIVGSLALLMFVYGGLMFLISAGSSDRVNKARTILTAAVVGLIIVFTSFLIIQFVLKSIGINWEGQRLELTGQASTK